MLQEFPTLVVIMISNAGAKPGVYPMLQLLSLVLLQVHIGQAAPHTEVSNIGLAAIPELKGGTVLHCGGACCRCSWRREQPYSLNASRMVSSRLLVSRLSQRQRVKSSVSVRR